MAVNRTSKAKGKVVDIPANAPTIGTPTDAGDGTTANVAFTAPSTSTGGPIFSYTATSNPGSFTGTGTSTSTVAVTGLTAGTAYTFTVKATNPTGSGPASSSSSSLTLAVPTSYYSIATVTVSGSTTNTITFSSIPQTYKHLQLRGILRGTSAGGNWHSISINGTSWTNGDTYSSNYAGHDIYSSGTGTLAEAFNRQYWVAPAAAFASANTFNPIVWDFFDYTDTGKYKLSKGFTGYTDSTLGSTTGISTRFNSTAAISSIQIFTDSGIYFAPNTTLALYGIKG